MKTRPVFESFDQFINFMRSESDLILEKEITVEEFTNRLSSFLDADAKKALLGVKSSAEGSPFLTSKDGAGALSTFKTALNLLANKIETYQKNEDEGGLEIEYWGTTQSDIEITQMVSGNVKYIGGIAVPAAGALKSKDWNPIDDVIALVNRNNIAYGDDFPDTEKGKWIKKDGFITNGSSNGQRVISSVDTGINFVNLSQGENQNVLDNTIQGLQFNLGEYYDKDTFKYSTVYKNIVLYTIKNVKAGAGDVIPSSYIKKEFSTIVIPGEVVELVRILEGTDKMFAQGVSTLAKDKEEMTKKSIDQLLGEFSSIESINVVGGASYEGGLEVNKKLVAGRATTVKNLIESMHPEIKGKVTADTTDFSKIQPKDESAEYTKWRRIYLTIKGNVIGDSKTVKKEVTSTFGVDIKFDKVTLTQWVLNLEFTKKGKKK